MLRELTHAGAFWSFQLEMSKMCWVKSTIPIIIGNLYSSRLIIYSDAYARVTNCMRPK